MEVKAIMNQNVAPEYKLMPLAEVEKYIIAENHLPNLKSEKEFNHDAGLNLGELN